MDRDYILSEMRRTAKENGGKPLGIARFEQVTSIRPYDWSGFWVRFSDLQREAGYEPNTLVGSFSDEVLLTQLALLTHELGHLPVRNEMLIKRREDLNFPSFKVYDRFGNKQQLISKLLAFCTSDEKYAGLVEILEPLVKDISTGQDDVVIEDLKYGFVYLVKGHPGEYKIGRTNLVDRRLSELGATASIEQQLIHEIKTDDPVGIEAYWHKRFHGKRMRGEWFKLNSADTKAFKRWKRIF